MSVAASTSDPIESVVNQLAPAPATPSRDQWDDVVDAVVPPKPAQPMNVVGVPGQGPNGVRPGTTSELATDAGPIKGTGQYIAGEAMRGIQTGAAAWVNYFENGRTMGARLMAKALNLPPAIAEKMMAQAGIKSDPLLNPTDPASMTFGGTVDPQKVEQSVAQGQFRSPIVQAAGQFAQIPGQMLDPEQFAMMEAGGVMGRGVGAAAEGMGAAGVRAVAPAITGGEAAVGAAGRAVESGANLATYSAAASPGGLEDKGEAAALGAALGIGGSAAATLFKIVGPEVAQRITQAATRFRGEPTEVPNAEQVQSPTQPDGGVQPRGDVQEVPPQEGGAGVQPSGQGQEAPQPVPDGAAPEGVAPAQPPQVVALRAELDRAQAAMDDAKRAMEPTGEPKDIGDLAGKFQLATEEWKKVHSRYQQSLLGAGLPLDTTVPPTMTSKAPVAEPTEPPPIPPDLKSISRPDLNKLAEAHGVDSTKVREWVEKRLEAKTGSAASVQPAGPATASSGESPTKATESTPLQPKAVVPETQTTPVAREAEAQRPDSRPTSQTPPESPAPESSPNDTTGIAHRVSESRGLDIQRGEGTTGEESVARGRELLKGGADPEATLKAAEADPKRLSDAVAIARAQQETLAKAANAAADAHGTDSPEYKAAAKADADWLQRIKVLATESHRAMVSHQGETEIDTGTYHGLAREYRDKTGKDFTPEQAATAKEHVGKVQEATKADTEARQRLLDHVSKGEPDLSPQAKSLADRIVAKLDKAAADALARFKARQSSPRLHTGLPADDLADLSIYGAAKVAKGFVKFADWSVEMVKDIGESIRPHLQQIWDAADKHLDKAVEEGGKDAPAIKAKIGKKPEVDLADHPPGSKMTPERVKALWQKAKDYIDAGAHNLDDVVHKLKIDTGLDSTDIRKGLMQPKGMRRITDDLYKKMSDRRAVVQQAKDWVQGQVIGTPVKLAGIIPRALFGFKTLGHSTVSLITHAGPTAAEKPVFTADFAEYAKAFGKQYKFMASKAAHEVAMQDLQRDSHYIEAKRAGLANDVNKTTDEYQNYARELFGLMGIKSGPRAFDALKVLRQGLYNAERARLPDSLIGDKEAMENTARSVNLLTGAAKDPLGAGTTATKILNNAAFAPRLEASRWGYTVGDVARVAKTFVNWKNATTAAKYDFWRIIRQKGQLIANYGTLLAINQAILSLTGSKQSINFRDPSRNDWLSFKVAGQNVGIIGPMLGSIRFMIDLAKYPLESSKELRGDQPFNAAGERATKYVRSKLSPFGQTAANAYSGADWQGRPMPWSDRPVPKHLQDEGLGKIGWGEYAGETFLPIPVEDGLKDVWKSGGMSESDMKTWLGAIGKAIVSGGTGVRVSEDYPERQPSGPAPKVSPYVAPGTPKPARTKKTNPYQVNP